jgi:hypothetical protein
LSAPTPKPNLSAMRPPCPICGNALWLIMTEPLEFGTERHILRCEVCKADQVKVEATEAR